MTMRRFFTAVWCVACVGALQGCELVADFDRGKIPGPDASIDATVTFPDASDDDAGSMDADAGAGDASPPATKDAGSDDGG